MELGDSMKLKVIADGLGLTKGINYAVYDTCKEGIVTSVSLIVNTKYTEHGYDLIKDLNVSIGLALNVTHGRSLSLNSKLEAYDFLKPTHEYALVMDAVKEEYECQIKKALSMGIVIDHLATYDDLHYKESLVEELLKELSERYNIPYRDKQVCQLFSGPMVSLDMLFYLIKQKTKYLELSVRPGFLDGQLLNISEYREMRMVEHSLLTSAYVHQLILDEGVELVG